MRLLFGDPSHFRRKKATGDFLALQLKGCAKVQEVQDPSVRVQLSRPEQLAQSRPDTAEGLEAILLAAGGRNPSPLIPMHLAARSSCGIFYIRKLACILEEVQGNNLSNGLPSLANIVSMPPPNSPSRALLFMT